MPAIRPFKNSFAACIKVLQFEPGKSVRLLIILLVAAILETIGLTTLIPVFQAFQNPESQFPLPWAEFVSVDRNTALIVFSALILLRIGFSYLAQTESAAYQATLVSSVRKTSYQKLMHSSWPRITQQNSEDIAFYLTTAMQQLGAFAFLTISCLNNGIMIFMYIGLMLVLTPGLLLALIPLGLCLTPVLIYYFKQTHDKAHSLINRQKQHEDRGQQFQTRYRHIHGFNRQTLECREQTNESDAIARDQIDLGKTQALAQLWQAIAGLCLILTITVIALGFYEHAIESLLISIFALSRLLPKLSMLQRYIQQLIATAPVMSSFEQWQCSLDPLPSLQTIRPKEAQHTPFEITLPRQFVLEDISFDAETLCVRPGDRIGLIGPSGVGKSLILDLLAGFLEDEHTTLSRPDHITYIHQSAPIWQRSAREALLWANPAASDEAMLLTLEQVGLKRRFSAVESLGEALGDQAVMLSGGEQKRINIAQLLLCEPQLALLDEVTANCDTETEQACIQALRYLPNDCAMIMASHQAGVLQWADKIWEITISPNTGARNITVRSNPSQPH